MAEQSDMAGITSIGWNDLPDHLKEKILLRQPFKSLFRLRRVCKGWNSLLTSNPFLQNPWLMLCRKNIQMPCLVYSFELQSWETLSLTSLFKEKCAICYPGSTSGLLLVKMRTFRRSASANPFLQRRRFEFGVCNPLSRTFRELPDIPYSLTKVIASGIVDGDGGEGYKVIMLGRSSQHTVEGHVYDSAVGSWTLIPIVLREALNVNVLKVLNEEMVFCDGKFFCLTVDPWEAIRRILVLDVQGDGNCTVLPMPSGYDLFSRLLTWGDSVLMTGVRVEHGMMKDVIIWQYCCSTWREVARMDISLCNVFWRWRWIHELHPQRSRCECVVVGGNVCFITYRTLMVFVYSMTTGSWTWLPKCPFASTFGNRKKPLPFQPRPQMGI